MKIDTQIYFFFSNHSYESLNTKFILSSVLGQNTNLLKIGYKEINVNKDPLLCTKYNVQGVPTTLILKKDKVINKVLGELGVEQVISLIKELKYKNVKVKK